MFRSPEYPEFVIYFQLLSSGLWGQILPKSKKGFCPSRKEFFFSSFIFSLYK